VAWPVYWKYRPASSKAPLAAAITFRTGVCECMKVHYKKKQKKLEQKKLNTAQRKNKNTCLMN